MLGYIYVLEHFGGAQHIDIDWSRTFEDLYSLELDFRISFDRLLSVTNLFKQHPSHMMPQKILESPKKWRIGRVRRMCLTKCLKRLDELGCSMNHVGTVQKAHLRQTLERR